MCICVYVYIHDCLVNGKPKLGIKSRKETNQRVSCLNFLLIAPTFPRQARPQGIRRHHSLLA